MEERLSGTALTDWIIERLAIFREKTGLTTEEFAEKVGITAGYIYKIERRESEPSIEVVDAWLTACGKDLASFFQDLAPTGKRHPEWTRWHDRLDSILGCPEDITVDGISIVNGIKLNLIAVAREAERAMRAVNRKARAEAGSAEGSPRPRKRKTQKTGPRLKLVGRG